MSRKMPRPAGYHWTQAAMEVRADGKRACKWCRSAVQPPKRNWCPDPLCVFEWQRRTTWSLTRDEVFRRAGGICALCGYDLNQQDVQGFRYQLRLLDTATRTGPETWARFTPPVVLRPDGTPYPRDHWHGLIDAALDWRLAQGLPLDRSPWEADHVVPVSAGGSWFDWENLRLVDSVCHKRVTAEYAKARAAARRALAVKGV